MDKVLILEKVVKISNLQIGMSENNNTPPETALYDLGMDSLDHIEVIMCLEEEFEIEIDDDEAMKAKTIDDLVVLVENLL
jgi:acyl carrier protein